LDDLEQPLAAYISGEAVTEQTILVEGEYGEGAYGPTILLLLRSSEGVAYLRNIFEALAGSAEGTVVRLSDKPGISIGAALWDLKLKVVKSSLQKHLSRNDEGGFTWVGTSDDWETMSLMMEPLLDQRGHQYLTSEIEDDALIEVSRGEH